MGRSTSRRTVEILYDVQTRGAIADIRKFAREHGLQLRSVRTSARQTAQATRDIADELRRTANQARLVGGAILGAIAFEQIRQGFQSLVEITREYRGENDELVQSMDETGAALQGVVAALGTVIFGAAQQGGALANFNDGLRELSTEMLNADTAVGGFVRGVLAELVSFGAVAAEVMIRIARAVFDVVDILRVASREFEQSLHEADLEDAQDDLARTRDMLHDLREAFDRATDRQIRLDLAQGIEDLFAQEANILSRIQAMREGPLAGVRGEIDEILVRMSARAESTTELLNRIQNFSAQLRAGLSESFELEQARAETSERTAAALQDQVGHTRDLVGQAVEAAALAERLRRKDPEPEVDPFFKRPSGADVALGIVEMARAVSEDVRSTRIFSMDSILQAQVPGVLSSLSQVQNAFGAFFASGLRGAKDFGEQLAQILAGQLGSIGGAFNQAAALAATAGTGPWGLFLALGGAFSIASGLLGGGGTGGRGQQLRTPNRTPDVIASIRPEISRATGNTTYVVQTGAVFLTRDDTRREVAGLFGEARKRGEL